MICKQGDNFIFENNQDGCRISYLKAFVICTRGLTSLKLMVCGLSPFYKIGAVCILWAPFTLSSIPLVSMWPFGTKHDVSQVNLFRS